jgi:hypothetical protein
MSSSEFSLNVLYVRLQEMTFESKLLKADTYALIESSAITRSFHHSWFRSIYASIFCKGKLHNKKPVHSTIKPTTTKAKNT